MHPQEREAVFGLVVILLACILFAVATALVPLRIAFAVFGLTGVIGFSPFFFYRRRRDRVLMDERDRWISMVAGNVSAGCLWACAVATCMVLLVRGGFTRDVCLPAVSFAHAIVIGTMVICAARAITVLVLYRRGGPHG